jgi:hypothetical protein
VAQRHTLASVAERHKLASVAQRHTLASVAGRHTLARQGDMYTHDVAIAGSGLAGLRAAMELVGQLDVAVVTKANPSRSAHFRADFPTRDDVNWLQHALAFRGADGGHELRYKPVTIARFQPEERNYL